MAEFLPALADLRSLIWWRLGVKWKIFPRLRGKLSVPSSAGISGGYRVDEGRGLGRLNA